MNRIKKICPHVYQVGGDGLSRPEDCCVYLVQGNGEAALIDTGAGRSAALIADNITAGGLHLEEIKYILVTHGHIDHIGGLKYYKQRLSAQVVAHRLELGAVSQGKPELTAAAWYGVQYQPVEVDRILEKEEEKIAVGGLELVCLHTPGHTPGSISIYVDCGDQRVLFGQDIHGPFNPAWGSDMEEWHQSMQILLALQADILCEGHFGVYRPASEVTNYISGYINRHL